LSGRENIFFTGTLMGLRRREVAKRLDEIVAFAELESAIDRQVKYYSSGMQMRLGFGVAAFLEPAVLLVDEVLAVGDAEFQKRSLGKMRDATGEGRTVVFVSHNMASIRSLCQRAILLDGGRVRIDGGVDEVLGEYLATDVKAASSGVIPPGVPRLGSGEVRVRRVGLLDTGGRELWQACLGQPLVVELELEAIRPAKAAAVEVGISSLDGTRVVTAFSTDGEAPPLVLERGVTRIAVELEPFLLPGHYALDLGIHHLGPAWALDLVERIRDFEVLNVAETGGDRYPAGKVRGYVRPRARWRQPEAEESPAVSLGVSE